MHFLLHLALIAVGSSAWARSPRLVTVTRATAVRARPTASARRIFNLRRGERVAVYNTPGEGDFARIRARRQNGWQLGFAPWSALDLTAPPATRTRRNRAEAGWALGAAGLWSHLSQNGKSFETDDQVTYSTSRYAAQGVLPYVLAQSGRENFWRLGFGMRTPFFHGQASTDVSGAVAKDVDVHYTMYSLLVQKAWTLPLLGRALYAGVGAEAAKAVQMTISMGGIELPTSSSDLPLYLGLQGFSGVGVRVGERASVAVEARFGSFLNQAVPVLAMEAGGLALWWF